MVVVLSRHGGRQCHAGAGNRGAGDRAGARPVGSEPGPEPYAAGPGTVRAGPGGTRKAVPGTSACVYTQTGGGAHAAAGTGTRRTCPAARAAVQRSAGSRASPRPSQQRRREYPLPGARPARPPGGPRLVRTGLPAATPRRRQAAWKCAARDAFPGRERATRERDLQGLTNNTRFLVPDQVPGLIARRIRAAVRDVCLHPLVAGFRRELCATACARTEGRGTGDDTPASGGDPRCRQGKRRAGAPGLDCKSGSAHGRLRRPEGRERRDHPGGILAFMRDFAAPFDLPTPRALAWQAGNNRSERDLRAMKTRQRISGAFRGFRSPGNFRRIRGHVIHRAQERP